MRAILGSFQDVVYPLTRFVVGFLFLCHDAQKLFGLVGAEPKLDDPLMLVAGIVEFGGGLLVAVGLFGSIAAFVSSGQMAFAYFIGHAKNGFWPIQNGGELAVVYCFVFLYISARGSGAYSLDALLAGRKPRG